MIIECPCSEHCKHHDGCFKTSCTAPSYYIDTECHGCMSGCVAYLGPILGVDMSQFQEAINKFKVIDAIEYGGS
jgi:hypothetical protein